MRVLFVEVENGTTQVEKPPRNGGKRGPQSTRQIREVPVIELLKLEVPDNARVTLQGMNPANNHTNSGNPATLRVYVGSDKKQIATIPKVVAFREDTVKISRLQQKEGIVGMAWVEIKDNAIFGEQSGWIRVDPNPDEELEF